LDFTWKLGAGWGLRPPKVQATMIPLQQPLRRPALWQDKGPLKGSASQKGRLECRRKGLLRGEAGKGKPGRASRRLLFPREAFGPFQDHERRAKLNLDVVEKQAT